MEQRELKEKHPILEKIVSGFMFIPEIVIYLPIDIFQVPIRDWIIPRAIKRKWPSLSCREYYSPHLNRDEKCKPAEKYYHKEFFQCRYYDIESGECTKYKKKK